MKNIAAKLLQTGSFPVIFSFSALTLLTRQQEGHLPSKKPGVGLLAVTI